MTDSDLPAEWQSMAYDGKFLATFRMPGGSWKFLRAKGERLTFATDGEARAAAKLGLEDWLKSRRQDLKNEAVLRKSGRKPVIVWTGKAARA